MEKKKIRFFKKFISVTLATLFFVSFPLQVFAADVEMALPESYEGINEEEVEQQEALSDDELEQTLTSLQQNYTQDPSAPILSEPEFSQECTITPNLSKSGRNYQVESVTFSGVAKGNHVSGVNYRFNATDNYVAITDFTRETETLESSELALELVTVDKITWSVTLSKEQLEKGKVYLPEVSYTILEKTYDDNGKETETETTREFFADSYMIVSVDANQRLSQIANAYGVTVSSIKDANHITSLLSPKKNSTLFLSNPVVGDGVGITNGLTAKQVDALKLQGEISGMEYAYGYVSLYDGALMYTDSDIEIIEQETFSIDKVFHSKAQDIEGVFGCGTSSIFDQRIVEVDDTTFAFYMADGCAIKLIKNDTGYASADGEYVLTITDTEEKMEYKVSNQAGKYYVFDETGYLTSCGTKKGIIYSLTYDEEKGLSGLTTRAGKIYEITKDGRGHITQIKKPDGASITYKYNSSNLLIEKANERGKKTTFSFDEKKRLVKVVNPMGKAIAGFTYDDMGSVLTFVDGESKTARFVYDKENSKTDFYDPKNQKTTYTYNEYGRHTLIQYPDGTSEERSYDQRGNITSVKDKMGKTTAYSYDGKDHILTQTNPDNTTIQYTYDGRGNLLTETDEKGRVTTYSYDEASNPIKITYADGTNSCMSFDELGRMISATNQSGNTMRYEYEGTTFNISKVIDGNGAETVNTYDACDRLLTTTSGGKTTTYTYSLTGKKTSMTDAKGNKETYEYDDADQSIGITDPSGNHVGMRYDAMGRVTEVINADGSSTKFSYDANGNLTKEENANGEVKTYTYDSNDEVKSETSSGGSSVTYERDAKGRVTKETDKDGYTITYKYHDTLDVVVEKKDKLGRVTKYEYDKVGNLLKETRPDNTFISYTYDSNNRILTMLDEKNIKTEYTYDGDGRLTKEKQTSGSLSREKTYAYDGNGNLISETDYNGNATTYAYDSENRLIKVTDANGYSSSYTYDGLGNVLTETDRNGNVKKYTYDASGNMLSLTDACNYRYEYQYDSEGRVTLETKPNGVKIGAVYNENGYMAKQVDAFGNETSYTYDDNGNVTSQTDCNGNKTEYKYDCDNNKIQTTYANGAVEKFVYNKNGWLTKVTASSGAYKILSYDTMGNIVKISYSNGSEENYTYDSKGYLVKEVTRDGEVKEYSYDGLGNLTKYTSSSGESISYTYDSNGKVLSETLANGAVSTYTYDKMGNLLTVCACDGGITSYSYDGNGNVTKIIDALGQETTFQFDGNGNLIKTTTPDGFTSLVTYDYAGQILSKTDKLGNVTKYTYDAMENLSKETTPEGASFSYTYDKCGRQTSVTDGLGYKSTYEYDAMGNLVLETSPTGAKTTYEYDKQGLLTLQIAPDGGKTKYAYDVDGNLIKKTYPDGTNEAYTYDNANRVVTYENQHGIKSETTYNEMGLPETVVESGRETGDRVTSYTYDEFGRIVKEEQTGYHPVLYEYDIKGRVVCTSQGERKTTATYDPLDRVICETDVSGIVTNYTYDSNNNVLQKEVVAGGENAKRITAFSYDANGNLVETKAADGSVTKATYDKDNRLICETDARGNTTGYAYDKVGNVISVTDSYGKRNSYVYDGNRNVTAVTDANEVSINYGYDIMGRLNRVEEANGTCVHYVYDTAGNLTKEITTDKDDGIERLLGKSKRKVVTYNYNKLGDLICVGSPSGEHETFTYYKDGTLKKAISPSKKEIAYEYDVAGNLTGVYHDGDIFSKKTYDGYGQVTSMTDSNGKTSYGYDISGRITSVSCGGIKLAYAYDAFGNIKKLTYPDDTYVSYTYDVLNRMKSMTERNGVVVDYTYDKNSNLLSEKRSDGVSTTNTYDDLNRLTATKTVDQGTLLSAFSYQYDDAGRIVQERSTDSLGSLTKTYAYNSSGKLISYKEYSGTSAENSSLQKSIDYAYDLFGNRTDEVVIKGNTVTKTKYTYDASDRLKYKQENGKTTGTYTYDIDGNLVKKVENEKKTEYTYTTDNQLATVSVDGVLQQAIRYDGNGLKSLDILRKEYDETAVSDTVLKENEKRLKEWKKFYDTDATDRDLSKEKDSVVDKVKTVVVGHDYEEKALYLASFVGTIAPPLREEWWDFAKSFGNDITKLVHDLISDDEEKEEDVVGETTDDRGFSHLLKTVKKEKHIRNEHDQKVAYYVPSAYVYDLTKENAQVLVAFSSPKDVDTTDIYQYGAMGRTSSDEDGVYVYDGHGSVSETVSDSKVTSTLRYDPYGQITCGAPVQDTIFGYNGEQYTPQTGLIYLRARNYDPSTGTFTTKDTYLGNKLEPVTRNRYTYGNNNPITYQDPSGHKGKFSQTVAAVKQAVKNIPKTVAKVVQSAPKVVQNFKQTVSQKVQNIVSNSKILSGVKELAKTVKTKINNSKPVQLYNSAKAELVSATKVVMNKVSGQVGTMIRDASNVIGDVGSIVYTDVCTSVAEFKQTVRCYHDTMAGAAKVTLKQPWEDFKDSMENVLREVISVKHSITDAINEFNKWWGDTDNQFAKTVNTAMQINAAVNKFSMIGLAQTAVAISVNKAGAFLQEKFPFKEQVNNAVSNVQKFYNEHKTAINLIAGGAVIAGLIAATIGTGGATGGTLAEAASTEATLAEAAVAGETATGVTMAGMVSSGALEGAAIFGATGMVVDGFNGALTYMEKYNTLDGSGGYILESACSHVGGNVIKGAIAGGFFGAAKFHLGNPRNALPQNSPGEMLPEGGSGTNADFIVSPNGVVVDSKIGIESIPETKFTTNKLQHEFSHASDFGIEGNWNSAKGIEYQNAIQNNINNATDIYISKYRGTDVYVYYNSNTGLGSYVDYLGNYVGGWKFSTNQLNYHITNGLKIY